MWLRAACVSLVLAIVPSSASAQDPDTEAARCMDFGADDVEVTARIADIRARIALHEPDTRHWWTAWSTIFAGLMGVELTIAVTAADDGPRIDGIVSTISLALGLATQLIAYPPLLGAGGQLDALPESTPDERLAKLVAGERLLRRSAEGVRFSRGPIGPILSGLYSIAANTLLIVGFGRTVAAYIGVIGGIILGQGRIILQPYGIDREWRTYQAAHADAGCEASSAGMAPASSVDVRVLPTTTMGGAGLSLSLTF
jgi:hypothetical protein